MYQRFLGSQYMAGMGGMAGKGTTYERGGGIGKREVHSSDWEWAYHEVLCKESKR